MVAAGDEAFDGPGLFHQFHPAVRADIVKNPDSVIPVANYQQGEVDNVDRMNTASTGQLCESCNAKPGFCQHLVTFKPRECRRVVRQIRQAGQIPQRLAKNISVKSPTHILQYSGCSSVGPRREVFFMLADYIASYSPNPSYIWLLSCCYFGVTSGRKNSLIKLWASCRVKSWRWAGYSACHSPASTWLPINSISVQSDAEQD